MLRGKRFAKKTRKGGVVTVNREHYLRDDITCGFRGCPTCTQEPRQAPLLAGSALLPDTNVVLHQIDLLEHRSICNVILTSTVLNEVKHRSMASYNRLRTLIKDRDRRFFVHSNEHSRDTYVEQLKGESPNDRNDRAIRVASKWYQQHTAGAAEESEGDGAAAKPGLSEEEQLHVVLLTNDEDNLRKARADGIVAYKGRVALALSRDTGNQRAANGGHCCPFTLGGCDVHRHVSRHSLPPPLPSHAREATAVTT